MLEKEADQTQMRSKTRWQQQIKREENDTKIYILYSDSKVRYQLHCCSVKIHDELKSSEPNKIM